MPQFVPVTLKDGAFADHTFKPRDITGGVATLVESTGVPLGDRRITISTTRTATGKVKVLVKFALPVVENTTVNGVTRATVVRTNYAEMSFNYDAASTTDDRSTIVQHLHGFLNGNVNPMADAIIRDLEGLY